MSALESLVQPGIFPWVCLIVGLLMGSFLNVVIFRLPKMMERAWQEQCAEVNAGHAAAPATIPPTYNLMVPRSACPACGAPITALQNVPLLSYLWLRGRCAKCGTPIGARYPIVEAVTGMLSGYLAWRFGAGAAAPVAICFSGR